MNATFRTFPFAIACAFLGAFAPAQQSLADLRARFDADREALMEKQHGQITFEDVKQLAQQHSAALEKWLPTATGSDAINGRLLLANIYADTGREDRAREVLKALDHDDASALELVAAAEMAGALGLQAERTAWVEAAIAKDATFEQRMALALYLMTRLVEIEKGEAIIDAALEAAKDDEERAKVLWYRAAALREREDLPEGAFETALDELSKQYPDTYWGGVARDRLAAFDLDTGSAAIPFEAKTLSGETVKLADYAGKVLLLDFWSSAVRHGNPTAELSKMLAEFGEKGFQILGVALDEDREAVAAAAKERGKTWPHVFDGKGRLTDVALRYGIEQVPDYVLIGRDGKIAAVGIFLQDDYGVRELRDLIQSALARD